MQQNIKPFSRHLVAITTLSAILVVSAGSGRSDSPAIRSKKLLAIGWDQVTPARLRLNLKEMEKRPFNGVVLSATGKTIDNKDVYTHTAFSTAKWDESSFQKSIDDLKVSQSSQLTDNFVLLGANPGDVDWFDDDAWKNIAEHFRIAARIAREGKLKGIAFDPEAYNPPYAVFHYPSQAQFGVRSYEEYHVKARQRGREVMRAAVQEYPGLTLFCYWMNSINALAMGQADSQSVLATLPCGLLSPFIDGWLDVAPPTVTMVDGFEISYVYNSEAEFLRGANLVRNAALDLVSPENRAKYRAQVQTGFGVYLDAYKNPPGSSYYVHPQGSTPAERLQGNVASALRAADEYVWLYGEKYRWWPTPNESVNAQSWEDALPGLEEGLRYARDPLGAGRAKLATLQAAGTLKNLLANGDFSAGPPKKPEAAPADWAASGVPANWYSWQPDDSKGTFDWDARTDASSKNAGGKGAARISQSLMGSFIQTFDVHPGERYAVAASYRRQGAGNAWMRVRWQTPTGDWINNDTLDTLIYSNSIDSATTQKQNGWRDLFGVVRVPEGAGKLVILLATANQRTPQDVVWFDDVRLYSLR